MREQLLQQTLGQLASQIPGATRLFREHQLDFCCGGQHTLEQACQQPGLNLEQLLEALQALSQQPGSDQDWQATATPALIDHLLTRYHARHRQQFEELIRLASRVEQVHAASGDCPHGLTDFLHEMREALESHMMKEEQILFPMLLQGAGRMAGGPISVMRFEHDQHGDALAELSTLTNDMQPPAGACNTWRALYRGLDELRNDLLQHIHLENDILFLRS